MRRVDVSLHRGDTGDVSHDLIALAKTPIAVVSAGAKAILDLPRTAEMLETLGVLVIGYRTDELPAFYTLHVWAWKHNPNGAFVNWHPNVNCEPFNGDGN